MKPSLNIPFLARISAIAWRNVTRNWRHSLATILAIALGFASVSVFDGFIQDLKSRNEDGYIHRGMLGHVVVEKPDMEKMSPENPWKYSLNRQEQDFIDQFLKNDPAVSEKMRLLTITGLASAGDQSGFFQGLAIDPEAGAAIRKPHWEWNTLAGVPLHLAPPMSMNTGLLMGKTIGCVSTYDGPSIFLPFGNYIAKERPFHCEQPRVYLTVTTEASQVNVIDLKVAGLHDGGFRELDKRSVVLALKDAQRLFDTDKVTLYSVLLKDQNLTDEFTGRMNAAIDKSGLKIEVIPWIKHHSVAFIAGGLQILHVFRNLFMLVIIAIGVMAVANTMMKAVNERIREIGTLRSLGFRRSHLMVIFGFEGFYISLIACFIGFIVTLLVTLGVQMSGITFKAGIMSIPINLNIMYVPLAWAISSLVLTLLATGTALYSARRAVKMGIADALRHV